MFDCRCVSIISVVHHGKRPGFKKNDCRKKKPASVGNGRTPRPPPPRRRKLQKNEPLFNEKKGQSALEGFRGGEGSVCWLIEVDKREKPPFNGFLTIEFLFYHKLYQTVPSITKNGARLRSYIWLARHQKGLP